MTDYTPTTEQIRGRIHARDGFGFMDLEDFNTWLAAHDAEVRAAVVAEEPEWVEEWTAYARGVVDEFIIPEPKGPNYATHQRIVKAGPWVPVKP